LWKIQIEQGEDDTTLLSKENSKQRTKDTNETFL
jgi:hypothetical protein